MSNSEKTSLESTEVIIKGYIHRVLSNNIKRNNDNDEEYINDDCNIDTSDNIYDITIIVIDEDNDYAKYKLLGSSLNSPEENDLVCCEKSHIEHNPTYGKQYKADSLISISLPTNKQDVCNRIQSLIKTKKRKISIKIIDKFVDKFIDNIWEIRNDDSKKYEKTESIIVGDIHEYVNNKNGPGQRYKEHISVYFIENFDIILKPCDINKIVKILECNYVKMPIDNNKIQQCLLNFVGTLDLNLIITISSKLQINDFKKMEVAILDRLYTFLKNGDTCTKIEYLKTSTKKLYSEHMDKYDESITNLIKNEYVTEYDNYLFLTKIYKEERDIAININKYYQQSYGNLQINCSELNNDQMESKLNNEQKKAIINSFAFSLSIITGYPGVGKTTTAIHIAKLCKNNRLKIMLLGPTGKVSLKIINDLKKENLYDDNVLTIHKFISGLNFLNYLETLEKDHKQNILNNTESEIKKYYNLRMIIIDEVSMVTNELICKLMSELVQFGSKAHIIFMGDTEQLMGIGHGAVLLSLINCKKIPEIKLHQTFRGSDTVSIKITNFRNSNTVSENKIIFNNNTFRYEQINCIKQCEIKLCKELEYILSCKLNEKIITFDDIMIITPTHKNIEIFGSIIKKLINKNQQVNDKEKFTMGDYVMIKKNIYYKEEQTLHDKKLGKECNCKGKGCGKCIILKFNCDLYNGLIGKITKYEQDFYTIVFANGNDKIEVSFGATYMKSYVSLSYINTVHKYQGSENKIVIVIITEHDNTSINKNMIYTALSRATDKCLIITDDDVYNKGILKKCKRNTKLSDLLIEYLDTNNDVSKNEILNNAIEKYESSSEDEKPTKIKKNKSKTKKMHIPHALKMQVWDKWVGKNIGTIKCLCCDVNEISQMNFACGHIIAESKGGQLMTSNLKPICTPCNSSMGTHNMDEFKAKYLK